MSFVFFAWIASVSFGMVAIIGKLTNKLAIPNPWLFNFLWTLFSLGLIIPLCFANNAAIPDKWVFLILASLFNALFSALYIIGLSKLDVSVFVPLLNLRTVFISILGALFLGEILNPVSYFLVGLILIAGFFVSIDEKYSLKSFINKNIGVAMLCTLSYSLMGIFTKKAIDQNGYWSTTLWMGIASQLMLLATIPLFHKDLAKLKLHNIWPVFLMSFSLFIGILTENRAYMENVVITNIITALPVSMVLAFLFSIFAPHLLEKHALKVYAIRFTAAAVMILCALKLSI